MLNRDAPSGWPPELGRLEPLSFRDAAPDIKYDGPDGRTHGDLHQPDVVDGPGKGKDLGPLATLGPDARVPVAPLQHDLRDICVGFHIIEDSGLPPQALLGRKGRTRTRHAPAAFNRGHERCLLTAYKGPCPLIDVEIEGKTGTQDVLAKQAVLLGLVDGDIQPMHRQRVLGPAVDISLMGPNGLGRDDHPFQDGVGIGLQDAPVHVGPRVPLVCVAQDIFYLSWRLRGKLPLHACGESPSPSAA